MKKDAFVNHAFVVDRLDAARGALNASDCAETYDCRICLSGGLFC